METNRNSGRIGLYVHIPFCEKKCFYCDFYSIESHSQRDAFVDSLTKEIELFSINNPVRREASTIFFGGGTPSLLSAREMGRIIESIHKHFDITSDVEFTMECNPGTVTYESLLSYRQLGVNRLSFGVQSFFDDDLKFLSRIHDSKQAIEAITLARRSGFENVNLDLMYGLPNQTADRVLANLRQAVELNTPHISAYNLIVEPGTPLFTSVAAGEVKTLDESIEARMYDLTMSFMEQEGFEHYEISNYARPGFQCKHNLKYWNCEEYIGFGPSAHSYLDGTRWWNISSLSNYINELSENKLPISARETLTESQLTDEFVMLHLRQGQIDLQSLKDRFKIEIDHRFILDLEKNGYARASGDNIILTKKGFTVCDEIAEEVLSLNLTSMPDLRKAD
jgi:oxygen-independent coproporphyrinogen-3 oxidase